MSPHDHPEFARTLFDENSAALLLIDATTHTIVDANRAAERLTGDTRTQLIGRHASESFGADAIERFRDANGSVDGAFHFCATAGPRPVHLSINPLLRLQPPLLLCTLNAVPPGAGTKSASARENVLLEALLDAIPDVMCSKDTEMRFTGGNKAFEALAGITVDEVCGKTCETIFTAPWADRARHLEREVLRTGVASRVEETVLYPDGRSVVLDFLYCPVRAPEDGRIIGLVVVGRDVTERRSLEERLRHSQKMEAVGQLAGGVAHDFNNLLTVILGNLELTRDAVSEPAILETIKATEKAARRAAELTGQLLGFARRRPPQAQPVDLNEVVRETVGFLRRTIDPRITIDIRRSATPIVAKADPGQINQVLMNLGLNARDAMSAGGTLTIATSMIEVSTGTIPAPGRYARLSVRDSGVGMSAEVKARIFEPFFTTKSHEQGTGLGLAVVFGIVEAHGGWIGCDSAPGRGTAFDVLLPSDTAVPETLSTPQIMRSPLGRGERILYVDDDPMIRTLAKSILAHLGYEATFGIDGADGVEKFRDADGRFDLVLLDLTMPKMSGREALEAIRAIAPAMPVLLVSGYSDDRSAVEAEATGFLEKPFTPSGLGKVIRETLDARHQP